MITPQLLHEKIDETGLLSFFTEETLGSLSRFTHRMLEINVNVNLTNFTEDEEVLNFHILDSVHSLPTLKNLLRNPTESWIDLGSGCGFPGAVLAAAFPRLDVTLMDATHKKVLALKACVEAAGWSAKTLCERAEVLGRDPAHREAYDGVVCRAVADLPVLLEYAIPLLKPGGYLVNWMTESQIQFVDKSKKALDELKSKSVKKTPYSLLEGVQNRYFLIVEKLGKTPSHYPRASGVPSKKPL